MGSTTRKIHQPEPQLVHRRVKMLSIRSRQRGPSASYSLHAQSSSMLSPFYPWRPCGLCSHRSPAVPCSCCRTTPIPRRSKSLALTCSSPMSCRNSGLIDGDFSPSLQHNTSCLVLHAPPDCASSTPYPFVAPCLTIKGVNFVKAGTTQTPHSLREAH